MNDLNKLAQEIYAGNRLRGFDAAGENIGQSLMLVVSELGEALEAHRKGRYADIDAFEAKMKINAGFCPAFTSHIKDTFEDEIIDSLIRLFDLCGALNIDIERYMPLKLEFNSTRPYRHGKAY